MCGRYTITKNLTLVGDRFGFSAPDTEYGPRYNVAPGQYAPVVIWDGELNDGAGGRRVQLMRWGLVPFWAKDEKISYKLINARGETLPEKPSFRGALKERRCLVLADGFYEWAKVAGGKQPHYIRLTGGEPFAFAGLWERWDKGASAEPLYTFTIVTTEPNALVSRLHNRMPVILRPEDENRWLSPLATREELTELIGPFDQARMEYYPVSKLVNKPANDLPDCTLPLEEGMRDEG